MDRPIWGDALRTGVVGVLVVALGACLETKDYTPPDPPGPPTVPQLRLPQNGAYEGSTVTGALRPRLVWEPATLAEGSEGPISYELQLAAEAAFTTSVVAAMTADTSYQPMAALPVSTTPPVGRRYYWRVRACVAETCSAYSPTWTVNVGRSVKDFNGDGYDDVVVGSHTDLNDANRFGRVYVYFGGPGTTLNTVPDGYIADTTVEGWFGFSVSSAGDFNGDGFADVLVGSTKSDLGGVDSGAAYLYFGGPGVAFDAIADVVFSGEAAGDGFGYSVAGSGDFNGDGFSDISIGAAGNSGHGAGAGRVYVFLGSAAAGGGGLDMPEAVLDGEAAGDGFGVSVAVANDLNGDGFADLVVGKSYPIQEDAYLTCSVFYYLGGPGTSFDAGRDGVFRGGPNEKCSLTVTSGVDINRDGFTDLVARAGSRAEGGWLYLGGVTLAPEPDMIFNLSPRHYCRQAVAVGDVNGDGAGDIAITDADPSLVGRIPIYLGKAGAKSGALASTPAGVISGVGANSTGFGFAVRGAGDLNGDGFDDIVMGDPTDNTSTGRVYVYFGNGGAAIDTTPDAVLSGSLAWTYFGESVADRETRQRRYQARRSVHRAGRGSPQPGSR